MHACPRARVCERQEDVETRGWRSTRGLGETVGRETNCDFEREQDGGGKGQEKEKRDAQRRQQGR
eukprot:6195379-Pleurochrysis_carterae.AAC.2